MLPVAILSLVISIIYILLQSLDPSFYMHLSTDIFVFHARSLYFWEHLSLSGLGHNEYQPGAILFFILLGSFSFLFDNSFETFKWVLFAANIILIFSTAFLFYKMKKTYGILLLPLLLISLGPILLFRFDLLIIFLLTLFFYLWEEGKFEIAMALLSFSVLVKVYPVIFLPYLLWLTFRKYRLLNSFYLFSIFLSTLILYFLIYTLFLQISFKDTLISYNTHNLKSISTESVWTSLIYFVNIFRGLPFPTMESDFGINAIARNEIFPSINFYNYFWILPLGILNLLYFIRRKTINSLDYKFLILNLLVFLIFSKVLANQYLGWFLFLLPLLSLKELLTKTWIINIFLIILTTLLHTFIYPLHYTDWLRILNQKQPDLFLTGIMLISSLILIILGIRISYDVFKNIKE